MLDAPDAPVIAHYSDSPWRWEHRGYRHDRWGRIRGTVPPQRGAPTSTAVDGNLVFTIHGPTVDRKGYDLHVEWTNGHVRHDLHRRCALASHQRARAEALAVDRACARWERRRVADPLTTFVETLRKRGGYETQIPLAWHVAAGAAGDPIAAAWAGSTWPAAMAKMLEYVGRTTFAWVSRERPNMLYEPIMPRSGLGVLDTLYDVDWLRAVYAPVTLAEVVAAAGVRAAGGTPQAP